MITVYDIPSSAQAFFPTWVEWPDMADVFGPLNAPSTWTRKDGSPGYSVPVIHDEKTGRTISDSWKIIQYLEEEYPETRRLIPKGARALTGVFVESFEDTIDRSGSWEPWTLPATCKILHSKSAAYFRMTRERHVGKLEDLVRSEEKEGKWAAFEKSFEWIEGKYKEAEGTYLMGEQVTFADIVVISWLRWLKVIFGEDSERWKDISERFSGGQWGKLIAGQSGYITVVE
ncbi:hypothetical protein DL96DRAFT_1622576 [Flagelloscypha sp. PMI_526]|nr:hypothetical protein DL96DRAFT_1622576 [Flagelloscypha sp. PMI_526]